jgi:hypothetical protein
MHCEINEKKKKELLGSLAMLPPPLLSTYLACIVEAHICRSHLPHFLQITKHVKPRQREHRRK